MERRQAARVEVHGDDSGATETLVYLDRDHFHRFSDWGDALAELGRQDRLEVDPAGCQFLLAYGLVPPPYTLYANLFRLGMGDRLRIEPDRATFTVDFPYFEARSREDGSLDLERLKRRLGEAVGRAVAGSPDAL